MRKTKGLPAIAALLFAACTAASAARAQAPGTGAPAAAPEVHVEIAPVINTGGSSTAIAWGWTELFVRIDNRSSKPVRGVVKVQTEQHPDRHFFTASAPYSVGAGASASVRVPTQVLPYADVTVLVLDDALGEIGSQRYSSTAQSNVVLFDVSEPSRLRGAVHEAYIAPTYAPPGSSTHSSGTGMSLLVGSPRVDPATGDVILPDRASLYTSADAVLLRSDTLARLTGPELDALAGYALAGGTLAITIVRPEDMRHPTLVALVGGEITRAPVHSETLTPITLPSPFGSAGGAGKAIPSPAKAQDSVGEALTGYAGGNLRGSAFGASATYGLGEVHLLAFDPTRQPAVDDDWVKARMIDLARRGYDRRSTLAFRPGGLSPGRDLNGIRRQLDPNEGSRWAIGAAALLLCIYAVLAGPVNFSLAAKKGTPLRALRHLPIIAAAAFAIIVALGVAAKGVSGRARHLTLIEAGAGMTKGTARRWRGFFTSSAKELTVRTTDATSIVSAAVLAESAERSEHLLIDRDGARLTDVAALPWQTIVVREDGFASLGDGIAMVKEGATDLAVVNRSGRALRAAILWTPSGDARYFGRIEDGARVLASAGGEIAATTEGRLWYSQVLATTYAGGVSMHQLNSSLLHPVIDQDAPGLSDAWGALEQSTDAMIDWFPDGVPVLLAQLDGGEGKMSDSGLRLESDRLLVRVVGFGGKP